MPVKVLFLSPFPPRPLYGGAVVRIHHLVRGLARRYSIVWACRAPVGPDALCRTVPNRPERWLQVLNPWWLLHLLTVVRREQCTLIVASSMVCGLHALLLHWLSGLPLIYDAHNVESVLWQRTGHRQWRWMAWFETRLCRAARQVWTVSEADAERFRRLGVRADRLRVVPNGAEMEISRCPPAPRLGLALPDQALLLYFGVLSYGPNATAIDMLRTEVLPRLDQRGFRYQVLIAGHGMEPHQEGPVRWLGFVDALMPLVRAADVVLVPVVSGSGTRIKILEALAAGTPVVSTELGAEGLDHEACGDGLAVAQDWDHFATLVTSRAGRRYPPSPTFQEVYAWQSIVDRIVLEGV